MTFQIRHDGKTFTVHTEVGDGLTKVVFDEAPACDQAAAEISQPERSSE